MICTIFKNIYDHTPYYMGIDNALERIKNGRSKGLVSEIRNQIDKERQDALKRNLPSVCFSGQFKDRRDDLIIEHSKCIVLDFDDVYDVKKRKYELSTNEYTYACWISPRNNGLKLLIKVFDGAKHRQHFDALRDIFPDADKSGVNESRVCFESYDPDIFINKKAKIFKTVKIVEKVQATNSIVNERKIFENITKWLSNKGDAFITGERNHFIFKLASACCRFGLEQEACIILVNENYEIGTNKFSALECTRTVQSAYKSNKDLFGSAQFDKETLIDKVSRHEIEITQEMMDANIRPKDVIFGEDVKDEVFDIYNNGYQAVKGIGVSALDELFKFKEGEISLLSGYGNYGKSTLLSWKLLMRILIYGEKYAFFSPEENASEFYHNLTEILLGGDCTPDNKFRPSKDEYEFAYDFISKHIFYVYPKQLAPTPDYIKERFLELIIKEKVKGVIIDPFNQLTNDYKGMNGRTDKYLETFLSDCTRFSQQNNIYFVIVAHPVKSRKDERGNYPCPDVFDIADGAMWNNKMDNIIIYDRPNHQVDPSSDVCELHSKKIRRQKIVGKKGKISFNFSRRTRRYLFNGIDYMALAISNSPFYKGAGATVQLPQIKPPSSFNFSESKKETEFKLGPNYNFDTPKGSIENPEDLHF